jgi:putative DNA primase/helicase
MRVDELLSRLEGVRGSNGQWTARCPAHEDRQASLTIATGRDGALLLTCWAGCELDAIVRAVRADVSDLFPDSHERQRAALTNGSPRPSLAAMTLPTDREVVQYAERLQRSPEQLRVIFDAKGWRAGTCAVLELGLVGDRVSIPVRDPSTHALRNLLRYSVNGRGRGPKMLAESGFPRVPLYALVDDDGPVWIVEGEADAISVASVGLNVIGAPGASAKAHGEWLELVRGRDVIVCFDHDDAGRKAAARWARAAHNRGGRVHVAVWPDGTPDKYDVGELVLKHRDAPAEARAALLELAADAHVYELPVERTAPPLGEPLSDDAIAAISAGELITRTVASTRSKRVVWLWRDRIPRGRVGIVYGPPGQGKSTLLALIIADVTRAGGRVLIASAEDDIETAIRPRLIAHDADLERVTLLSTKASEGETTLSLPRDLPALGEQMQGHSLVLIDPLSAHQGEDVNTWQEASVRALIFAPLMWHAKRADCAVVAIMHLNKMQGGDPLSRISGSGGYGGAARFAFLLGSHPGDVGKDDPRLVLVHVKASEGAKRRALTFRRTIAHVHDEGVELETPLLELVRDDEQLSAEAVLAVTDPDEQGAFTQAVEWLRYELSDGPKLSKRLLSTARERGDFGERTLRRAKGVLDIRSERSQEGWLWVPPTTWA